ncbi:hypothetical protein P3L10_001687 [Capsicum annuum]
MLSRWVELFSCIVGKTSTIDVISNHIGGGRNGTLQLIKTEFQIFSDLVPVREVKFLRFCSNMVKVSGLSWMFLLIQFQKVHNNVKLEVVGGFRRVVLFKISCWLLQGDMD